MQEHTRQKGAVSLFVVIFAALLITVVTVSFIRIMVQNQQQATAVDLSQSAYDSAQAGVEDAKRALVKYQQICATGTAEACAEIKNQVINKWASECNTSIANLTDISFSGSEVRVQTGSNSNALNQAYTCVKVNTQTSNYVGRLNNNTSTTIPLVGVGDFNQIKIEWFDGKDLHGSSTVGGLSSGEVPLLSQDSWSSTAIPNRPSLLRAQLIEYNTSSGFMLSDLDGNASGDPASGALFLYPSLSLGTSSFSSNTRVKPTNPSYNAPVQAQCKEDLSVGGYACSDTLDLPSKVDSGHKAYLVLKPYYKSTNFRITLIDSGSPEAPVKFNDVQPEIDSTGRANSLFRRVQARVEGSRALQPEMIVNGNLCKNFMVTNDTRIEGSSPTCKP
jgi:hypothetical protein